MIKPGEYYRDQSFVLHVDKIIGTNVCYRGCNLNHEGYHGYGWWHNDANLSYLINRIENRGVKPDQRTYRVYPTFVGFKE